MRASGACIAGWQQSPHALMTHTAHSYMHQAKVIIDAMTQFLVRVPLVLILLSSGMLSSTSLRQRTNGQPPTARF